MLIEKIVATNAPTPAGAYSQAVKAGNLLFVSGQLPIDPVSNKPIIGHIEEQIHQVFKNLEAILFAAGTDLNHVVKMTVFISDINNWGIVNEIYSTYFTGSVLPSRSVVPTNDLHYGLPIEIEAIAIIPEKKSTI
jgi:2-iminobutanoate/2-iminopropanoate deaminase